MDEPALIAQFKKGNSKAFDALVDVHRDRIVGVARRFLRDEHEALDVAQDAFVALYRVLPDWKPEAQLFTWLYRTTLNLCSKRLRSRERIAPIDDTLDRHSPVLDSFERADLALALDEALESLSDKQREVFLGCHERGLTLDQVASGLGMAPGTARSHLHRALATLRDRLKSRRLF